MAFETYSSAQTFLHGFDVRANDGERSTAILVEPFVIASACIVSCSATASTMTAAIIWATLNAAVSAAP
jgi:hypothetical protein